MPRRWPSTCRQRTAKCCGLLVEAPAPIRATASARIEDDDDREFARLYPPRSAAEADRRAREDEQISAGRGTRSEDDLYDAIFGGLR